MQISQNITTDNLNWFQSFVKDFGISGTVILALCLVGIYTFYKWSIAKIDILKEGKDDEIEKLEHKLQKEKSKIEDLRIEYARNLENIQKGATSSYKEDVTFAEETLNDLTFHPFFSNIDYWINIRIPQTHIKNRTKRHVFVDYMTLKFSLQKKMYLDFLRRRDVEKYGLDELKSDLLGLNNQYAIELQRQIDKYKLPSISVEKFRDVWNIYDSLYVSFVNSVISSETTENNYDRVYLILDSLKNINEVLLLDFVTKIDALNGELEDSNYTSKINQIKKEYE